MEPAPRRKGFERLVFWDEMPFGMRILRRLVPKIACGHVKWHKNLIGPKELNMERKQVPTKKGRLPPGCRGGGFLQAVALIPLEADSPCQAHIVNDMLRAYAPFAY